MPGWGLFSAAGDRWHHVRGCGAPMARAHDSDPQAGGAAQIIGRSGAGAGVIRLRLAAEIPDGELLRAVTAIMAALDADAPGAGSHCGTARVVLVLPSQVRDSMAPQK